MRPLKAAEMQEANLTSMVLFMKRIDIAGLGHCDFMSRPGSLARAGRGGRHWAPDLALRAGTGCGLSGRTFLIRDRRSPKCKNVGSSCSDCRGHWPWEPAPSRSGGTVSVEGGAGWDQQAAGDLLGARPSPVSHAVPGEVPRRSLLWN